jgi:hypothetical protein
MCTNSTEGIPNNKEAKNSSTGSREILSCRLSCFYRLYIEQQIPRPVDKRRRCRAYYSGKKKKRYTAVKNQVMVNNHVTSFIKQITKKERDTTMMFIRGIVLLLPNKLLM